MGAHIAIEKCGTCDWGFTRMPFGRSLAPEMLHRHASHAEAVARIGWCVSERALGVMTGEVGAGKTVAIRAALAGLDASRTTVYSLAGHQLVRDELPNSVGPGSPSEVPAVLLARLALDRSLQGQGQGGVLLADALERIVVATQTVAARIVVVDALHERAATFYEHYGFKRIPGALRLVQNVSDVAAALHS